MHNINDKDTVELWKPIIDWSGYEVSNMGNIRSFLNKYPRNNIKRDIPIILKGGIDKDGYRRLVLSNGNFRGYFRFSYLVAKYFIGERPKGLMICHKNGINNDDRVENLEYKTQKENIHDKFIHGTMPIGEKHYGCKLTENQAREIFYSDCPYKDLEAKFNIDKSTIYDIKSKRTWRHLNL